MSIGVLVDNRRYANKNSFIHQLILSLKGANKNLKFYDWNLINHLNGFREFTSRQIRRHEFVIILVRQRTFHQNFESLKSFLGETPIVVYDQDPWNAYMDDYFTQGHYGRIKQRFNLIKLAVPSRFWSEYIANHEKIRVEFVRMGMLPQYCSSGPRFENRTQALAFRGTLYDHRKSFFRELSLMGVTVSLENNTLSYREYLNYLDDVKIFLHDESAPLICKGLKLPRSNQMWHKDIETAARGTFVVRDYNEEGKAYAFESIPTIFTYESIKQIPDILKQIQSLDPDEKREKQTQSVLAISSRDDWLNTARALLQS